MSSHKNKVLLFISMIMVSITLFISCNKETNDTVSTEVVLISTETIEKLVGILPDVIMFNNAFQNSIGEQLTVDQYYDSYYQALRNNNYIQAKITEYEFESMDSFINLYQVFYESYVALKNDFVDVTNEVELLRENIKTEREEINTLLLYPNLASEERATLVERLDNLDDQEIMCDNLYIVKEYEAQIDRIQDTYNK